MNDSFVFGRRLARVRGWVWEAKHGNREERWVIGGAGIDEKLLGRWRREVGQGTRVGMDRGRLG